MTAIHSLMPIGGSSATGYCDQSIPTKTMKNQHTAGLVACCARMRLTVRLLGSAFWTRVTVPRTRMRSLAPACAVFEKTAKFGTRRQNFGDLTF